jgi:hypothetical protein
MNTGGGINTQGRHSFAMPEAVVKGELRPLRRRVCSWFNNRALPPHSSVWSGVALLPTRQEPSFHGFNRPTAIVATAPCNSLRN